MEKEKYIEVGSKTKEEKELLDKLNSATCLKDLNLAYDKSNRLIDLTTGEQFRFSTRRQFDVTSELISKHIISVMKTQFKMQELNLPTVDDRKDLVGIFMKPDIFSNTSKLLVILPGAGDAWVGQWASTLCMTRSLNEGSILPYIEIAITEGYSVVVANPNLNCYPVSMRTKLYTHHVSNLWDQIISKSTAANIFIAAHSYGGIMSAYLLNTKVWDFMIKVKAIALADSVHQLEDIDETESKREFFMEKSLNWVNNSEPIGTSIDIINGSVCVSSGAERHECVPGAIVTEIFKFFKERNSN